MRLSQYDDAAATTRVYSPDLPVVYPSMKLAGEAGEVVEKVAKWMRDSDWRPGMPPDPAKALDVMYELGDVLWYVSAIAADLGYDLETVAAMNIEKLAGRKERGTLHGSGDSR